MLTVASPMVDADRSRACAPSRIRKAIEETRAQTAAQRAAAAASASFMPFRLSVAAGPVRSNFETIADIGRAQRLPERPALLRRARLCWRWTPAPPSTTTPFALRGEQLHPATISIAPSFTPTPGTAADHPRSRRHRSATGEGRRRKVLLSPARQLHRPHPAHLAGRAGSFQRLALRRAARADLSRLLAAAPGAVRIRSLQPQRRPERAEHHAARRVRSKSARRT